MEFFSLLENAVSPILPGLIAAMGFIALGLTLRIRFRGQPLATRFKRPLALFVVYIFLFALVILSKLYWETAYRVTYLISILILALAMVLAIATAIFDVFIAKYRQLNIPSILKDMVVLVVYAIIVVLILHQEGVEVTSLVTTSAVFTAIIGFALQDLLSNVISGLAIQMENPFRPGDWVKFNDFEGEVKEINWRATKIQTLNRDIVVIPNNMATRSPIVNFSEPKTVHRRSITLGLRYEARPHQVHESLLKAVTTINGVLADPAPHVFTRKFSDFSIDYELFYFITDLPRREIIDSEVSSRIWYQLSRDGLSIPFPIRDVNVRTITEESEQHIADLQTEAIEKILVQVPEFAPLTSGQRQQLSQHAQKLYFACGERIITQGQHGGSFYIIGEGEISVVVSPENGDESYSLGTLGENEYFGERSLITGELTTASVDAKTDCTLYKISKDNFAALLVKNETLVNALGKRLAEREMEASDAKRRYLSDPADPSRPTEPSTFVSKIKHFFQL